MSQVLISKYLAELAKLRQVGDPDRESVLRDALEDLLDRLARLSTVSVDSANRVGAMTSAAR